MPILQVSDLKKVYTTRFGGQQVHALVNVNFEVEAGEYVAIMGESGSGKTTLLNILAALDKPTSGEVLLDGKNIVTIRERELAAFRRDHLGFVFQDFNLLDTFSIQDNILLPLVLAGKRFQEMERLLLPLARRLAVARALITEPRIVLADEPTGALDSKATDSLLGLFDQVNAEGQTILMVTHSTKAASHAKRVLFIRDGEVFHQIYKGVSSTEEMYQKISDTLTLLAAGGNDNG